ncbi:uncharacterized protein [Dermacentor albipictus]|uniref:uncharacterized protein n=1 Tax=Dermacentor albipictus TaxID=60249 RepID=UPI0031FBB53C
MAGDGDSERPANKRVIAGEQEKPASRAKSKIREMLSSLSESMKPLSETVSHLQDTVLAMEERASDWDKFRNIREEYAEDVDVKPDLECWTEQIGRDVEAATKKVSTDLPVEKMDSRLTHPLEAKQSLLSRWKGQRLNRRLRKKIAEVNKKIEEHCKVLSRKHWDDVCNSIDGQMRKGVSWNLLKHLLDETNTKSIQRSTVARILHAARQESSDDEVLGKLVNKYLPVVSGPATTPLKDYGDSDNPELDAEFGVEEIRRALHDLIGRSTPGPDKIPNKALRNLHDKSIEYLTEIVNQTWSSGRVSECGRGPPPSSFTSLPSRPVPTQSQAPLAHFVCGQGDRARNPQQGLQLGRQGRLSPQYDIGFRAGLSTQDATRLIKDQVIDHNTRDMRAILGRDLAKAFDSILHSFVLGTISSLVLGKHFHDFTRSLLADREAILQVGDLASDTVRLGSRGTPQGKECHIPDPL